MQVLSEVNKAFDSSFNLRVIKKEDVIEALVPLCRFVSAFPTHAEVEGYESYFTQHPNLKGQYGVSAAGLGLLTGVVVRACAWFLYQP